MLSNMRKLAVKTAAAGAVAATGASAAYLASDAEYSLCESGGMTGNEPWLARAEDRKGGITGAYGALANQMPKEVMQLTVPPDVPPPIKRKYPVHIVADLVATDEIQQISQFHKYPYWTFNGSVPGPMMRARVGDVLELRVTNKDSSGMAHNIDCHAVSGPGGGAPATYVEQDETKAGTFRLLDPGVFLYHCAAAPVPAHIQNGMFGACVVEPEECLPPVDKEFYIVQHEVYAEESDDDPSMLEPDYESGLAETPMYILFNGKEGSLIEKPLLTDQGDRVRLFVANAGPNLISSFHVIGVVFDTVYKEGDLQSPPARGCGTCILPASGCTMIEFNTIVPGNYTILDHAIFRIDKGCVGFLKVRGKPVPDIYDSLELPVNCEGCKLHN